MRDLPGPRNGKGQMVRMEKKVQKEIRVKMVSMELVLKEFRHLVGGTATVFFTDVKELNQL